LSLPERNPLPEFLYDVSEVPGIPNGQCKDILEPRGKLEALTSDAAAETTPLRNKLAEFVDDKLVAAIAAEYQKGSTLVLGTTNMDAGRAVSWNITRIAASGSPDTVQLIRDVMLASAAIPGAFPPVSFTVEAEGQL
jgi:predicted acylesterase/phospholipase RssA